MSAPDFADWLAICNVKARYCRLLDTKDWQGWGDLFTEDCAMDTRPAGGSLEQGRDTFVAAVRRSIEAATTVHQVHSPEITIEGDEASGIWAMQDRVDWGAGKALTGYGHYTERYRRCPDGQWRIASQVLSRLAVYPEGF
jgi:ketosteroid isomerase-like protein